MCDQSGLSTILKQNFKNSSFFKYFPKFHFPLRGTQQGSWVHYPKEKILGLKHSGKNGI